MLLTQTSFSSSPTTIKFSLGKCSHKHHKTPFFYTVEEQNKLSSKATRNRKLGLYFSTSPHQQSFGFESGDYGSGIGIDDFFAGKNIFITGATGLLGKALVEKLLRSTRVGRIYILVKAKDKDAALDRLSREIIQSELLETIREIHGSSYDEFIREKLIPIVGNICEMNLGMDTYSVQELTSQVDVIIESAANTNFDDRYDVMIDANVSAPQQLMGIAKRCKNLKLFVHISTAYVNGKREGVILEKPLVMGENERNDDGVLSSPGVGLMDEINLATKSCIDTTDFDATKKLKRLGIDRATLFGWHTTYQLTKAMGEMVLNEIRGDVPLLILRPSIIESSYKEPFPGWIKGNRMLDPMIISYGKGLLPGIFADPDTHIDIVPLDMVVNTTIAATAKHGIMNTKADELINVYHVATDFVNPLRVSDVFEYIYEHFSANPLAGSNNTVTKMKLFNEFSDLSKYLRDEISVRIGLNTKALQKQYRTKVAYAEKLSKTYGFVGFFNARFHTGNMQKLLQEMSKDEQVKFDVDATKIDWRKYFVEIHVPGLRKNVLDATN